MILSVSSIKKSVRSLPRRNENSLICVYLLVYTVVRSLPRRNENTDILFLPPKPFPMSEAYLEGMKTGTFVKLIFGFLIVRSLPRRNENLNRSKIVRFLFQSPKPTSKE